MIAAALGSLIGSVLGLAWARWHGWGFPEDLFCMIAAGMVGSPLCGYLARRLS